MWNAERHEQESILRSWALRERLGSGGTGAKREPPACPGSDGDLQHPTPMGGSMARRLREEVIFLSSALVRPCVDTASPQYLMDELQSVNCSEFRGGPRVAVQVPRRLCRLWPGWIQP